MSGGFRTVLTVDLDGRKADVLASLDQWFITTTALDKIHAKKQIDAQKYRETGEVSVLLQGEADLYKITVEEQVAKIEAAAIVAEEKMVKTELMRRKAILDVKNAKTLAEIELALKQVPYGTLFQ